MSTGDFKPTGRKSFTYHTIDVYNDYLSSFGKDQGRTMGCTVPGISGRRCRTGTTYILFLMGRPFMNRSNEETFKIGHKS